MRGFLLLFLVAYVYGEYYEPENLTCHCTGCGDPSFGSFDGALLSIVKEQKTLISAWGKENWMDICKFGFRAVTKYVSQTLRIDWVGFGFGFRAHQTKNWRNFLLGQDTNCNALFAVRGDGYNGTDAVQSNPFFMSQTRRQRLCKWKVEEHNPNFVSIRSTCCPYALNWYPNCSNSCFELWVGEKYRNITSPMSGMCGQCNNNIRDDFRTCKNETLVSVTQNLTLISDSCKSGKRQGTGFTGGERLAKFSNPP